MPRIAEYPSASSFDENDVLLKDGVNGTKCISIDKVKEFMNGGITSVASYTLDISSEAFNDQQETIHHDNFHRAITGDKLWHIGNNGTDEFPMDYTSPRDDYETVDDGFRIINNKLTTDTSAAKKHAMRILNAVPNEPFLVEIGFSPVSLEEDENVPTQYTGITYNIEDEKNYDSYYFVYSPASKRISVRVYNMQNGVPETYTVSDTVVAYTSSSIRMLFCNGKVHIWYDEVYSYTLDASLKKNCRLGMSIPAASYAFSWDFINVHNLVKPIAINSGLVNDYHDPIEVNTNTHQKGNIAVYQSFNGSNFDYLYNPNSTIKRFSPRSERFELRKIDGDADGSRRSEVIIQGVPKFKLKKFKIEYDLYIPSEDFLIDTKSPDCITQVISLPNDVSQMPPEHQGYNPSISLRTFNGKFGIHIWGQSEPNTPTHETNTVYYFADIEYDKWIHFELYVKEGYMFAHCPLTIVKLDGKEVFRSTEPNSVNTARSAGIKYGIYKSDWYSGHASDTTKRVLYFDNVKLTI